MKGNLTPTEIRVYDLIVQARSDKEIANELEMSYGTVRFHVANLFLKFDVRKRIALVLTKLNGGEPDVNK